MKSLLLAGLALVTLTGIAPAQTRSGSLDLEYKPRQPAIQPVPRTVIEQDTSQALVEIERRRSERLLREDQPGPSRRPDLDHDVTQGIQGLGLGGALRR